MILHVYLQYLLSEVHIYIISTVFTKGIFLKIPTCVCLFVVFYHHVYPDPEIYRYVCVHRDMENSFIYYNRDFLLKMLRSEAKAGVICLPRMPLTAPELQNTGTNGILATWT